MRRKREKEGESVGGDGTVRLSEMTEGKRMTKVGRERKGRREKCNVRRWLKRICEAMGDNGERGEVSKETTGERKVCVRGRQMMREKKKRE